MEKYKGLTEPQISFLEGISVVLKVLVVLMIPLIITCIVMLIQLIY